MISPINYCLPATSSSWIRMSWLRPGDFIRSAGELRKLVINVVDGVPIYLDDIARVIDGPAEPASYTWIGFGPAADRQQQNPESTRPWPYPSLKKKVPMPSGWPKMSRIILQSLNAIYSRRKSTTASFETTAARPMTRSIILFPAFWWRC